MCVTSERGLRSGNRIASVYGASGRTFKIGEERIDFAIVTGTSFFFFFFFLLTIFRVNLVPAFDRPKDSCR